jgi:hypothetical protein
MALRALHRRVVLDPIGVTDGTNLPTPFADARYLVPVTDRALTMHRRRVFLDRPLLMTTETGRFGLMMLLMTSRTIEIACAHRGRGVTCSAGETRTAMDVV